MKTIAMAYQSHESINSLMETIGKQAKQAAHVIAGVPEDKKNVALRKAAIALRNRVEDILKANASDMTKALANGADSAFLDRLKLTSERINAMATGLEDIAKLSDPVGKVLAQWSRPNGLEIRRVAVPLGVIGIIFEARPNVTADAAGLCLKSGNAVILRAGSDSLDSAQAIVDAIHEGIESAGLPKEIIQLVPSKDREAVGVMLKMVDYIDVMIPRGGKSLCARVQEESRVPTLLHLEGNCHTYIHEHASPAMACEVLLNAKMRRTGICGATESIVVDQAVANTILPMIADTLIAAGCELRGDEAARAVDSRIIAATEEDWVTEYLAPIASVKVVKNLAEAIDFINTHGSHHTESIITDNGTAAEEFCKKIDSAIVMHNASTQFADGGEFGMGAEIGIATGRLHARGPVGVEQLTTYKYVVLGNGQIRPKA